MILNSADDILIGETQVSKVYAGDTEVWRAGDNFELDVTRFDSTDPKLYDTEGRVIGQVTMLSGNIADNVYTVSDGLHVTGLTVGTVNVDLRRDRSWTVEYSIKDYNYVRYPTTTVNWVMNAFNGALETAAVYDFDPHAVHCRLRGSSDPELYNHCALSTSENGFYDFATEPSMLYGFEMNYKWVNNGNTLSLWVNGIKKASMPSADLVNDSISSIGIPNSGNSAGSNSNSMVVSSFKVRNYADESIDRVLYKMRVTKFRAYEDWFTMLRFCLYTANDQLIDRNAGNYIAIFCNGGTAQDGVKNGESLAYSLLAKPQSDGVVHAHGYIYRPNHTVSGDVIEVVYSVPASLPDVASYSYIAPNDPSEAYAVRDPVSWSFEKSPDGGVTWTVLDTRSDVPNPGRGNETQRFYIS